jgi:hypothetical protein
MRKVYTYMFVSVGCLYIFMEKTQVSWRCAKKKKLVECQFCCLFRAHNFVLCIHIHVEFCMKIWTIITEPRTRNFRFCFIRNLLFIRERKCVVTGQFIDRRLFRPSVCNRSSSSAALTSSRKTAERNTRSGSCPPPSDGDTLQWTLAAWLARARGTPVDGEQRVGSDPTWHVPGPPATGGWERPGRIWFDECADFSRRWLVGDLQKAESEMPEPERGGARLAYYTTRAPGQRSPLLLPTVLYHSSVLHARRSKLALARTQTG